MKPRNVLIVEDDDNSSELLSTVVQSEGFVACVARSLAEARQLLVVHRPANSPAIPGLEPLAFPRWTTALLGAPAGDPKVRSKSESDAAAPRSPLPPSAPSAKSPSP